MIDSAHLALELLHYKVADVQAGRTPVGGTESAWALQRHLEELAHQLGSEERKTFQRLSSALGARPPASDASGTATAGLDDLVLDLGSDGGQAADAREEAGALLVFGDTAADGTPAPADPSEAWTPQEREERVALQRLAMRAWRRDAERFAQGVAAVWRAERDRTSARLLHATLRNLDRYRQEPSFTQDVNLRQFTVVEPMPERTDPLLSLSDVDSLATLAQDAVEAVRTLTERSPAPVIARHDSLDYLRRLALAVARDPYAGRTSYVEGRGPSATELRQALRDLGRQRLPEWQRNLRRRELEARLAERQALERQQRQLFQRDVLRFTELVHVFFERLARLLPRSYGGSADEPRLTGGVLFAVSSALRRETVPPEVRGVTVRLVGPTRFTFAGEEVTVGRDGGGWQVHFGGRPVPIEGSGPPPEGAAEAVEGFLEGQYLHVRMRATSGSLASRTAALAAVVRVLASPRRDAWLRALRLLAGGSSVDDKEAVLAALRRAAEITAPAPDRRAALERLLAGALRAVGASLDDGALQALVQRAHLSLTAQAEHLDEALYFLTDLDTEAEPAQVVPFSGEPVDVDIKGRKVTIRSYGARGDDHLVATVPGQVLGAFRNELVAPLSGGTLACVHVDRQLAVAYLPSVSLDSEGASGSSTGDVNA